MWDYFKTAKEVAQLGIDWGASKGAAILEKGGKLKDAAVEVATSAANAAKEKAIDAAYAAKDAVVQGANTAKNMALDAAVATKKQQQMLRTTLAIESMQGLGRSSKAQRML